MKVISRKITPALIPASLALLSLSVLSYTLGPMSSRDVRGSVCLPTFFEHVYCRAVTASSAVSLYNPLVLAVSVVGLIGSLAYYIAFPDARVFHGKPRDTEVELYKVLLRFLKDDEKRVVELLKSSGGELLQKDIVRQSGLSKIKTHRIIVKLAERGVVGVERQSKANRIRLLIP